LSSKIAPGGNTFGYLSQLEMVHFTNRPEKKNCCIGKKYLNGVQARSVSWLKYRKKTSTTTTAQRSILAHKLKQVRFQFSSETFHGCFFCDKF